MSAIFQVLITCKACGVTNVPVTVTHRKENEAIDKWMDTIGNQIYFSHRMAFPLCNALVDVKIPLQKDKGIGF